MGHEVGRRLVHMSGVVVPLAYWLDFLTWPQVKALAAIGAVLTLLIEAVRLFGPIDFEREIFDPLIREYERDYLAGYALYVFSAAAVGLLFPPDVAIPAVLMLMIADPVIGIVGSIGANSWLKTETEVGLGVDSMKPVPILLSMFVLCAIIALPFVPPLSAVLAALAATIADGAKPVIGGYVVDDNLTIPPAAALAIVAGNVLVQPLVVV